MVISFVYSNNLAARVAVQLSFVDICHSISLDHVASDLHIFQ